MSGLTIDTNVLNQKADEIVNVSNSLDDMLDSLNSINFSSASEFDFNGAVSAIKSNIEGAKKKTNAMANIIRNVVAEHTKLQNEIQNNNPVNSSPVNSKASQNASTNHPSVENTSSPTIPNSSSNNSVGNNEPLFYEYSGHSSSPGVATSNTSFNASSGNTSSGVNINAPAGSLLDAMTVNQRDYNGVHINVDSPQFAAGALASSPLAEILASIFGENEKKGSYFLENFDDPALINFSNQEFSGSGPASMAMVLEKLTGKEQDPVAIANWAKENNYNDNDKGISFDFFEAISKEHNLECNSSPVIEKYLADSLKAHNPVIMYVKDETNIGRYVVLRGFMPDGKVIVFDPTNKEFSSSPVDLNYFFENGIEMFTFTGGNNINFSPFHNRNVDL